MYDNYTILVSGKEYTDLFKWGWSKHNFEQTYTNTNKIQLNDGEYVIQIVDNNNASNTFSRQIKVKKNGKTNELTFMLPEEVSNITVDNSSSETSKVNVIDALNYSRDVDMSDPQFKYALDLGYKTGDYKHNVVIPKITLTSENANEFNAKIYNLYKSQYEDIVNHKELQPTNITYTFKQQNGLVGIIITEQGGPIAGGGWFKYKCFYYDLNNDCEISFEEYLSTSGTSYTDLWNWFTATNEYKNDYADWGLDKIIGATVDNTSMDLVINLTMAYNTEEKLSFEQSVISNQSQLSDNGIVLDTPYFTLTLPSSWAGKYADAEVTYYPEGSKNYTISIAEKQSYDAGDGGHLIAYAVTFDSSGSYMSAIGYCIATGIVDDEKMYIYRYGPTDVQYTKKGEQQYNSMQNELDKIIFNIKDEYKEKN